MAKNTGLGRGFDSLIPVNFAVSDVATPGEQIKQIPIDKLVANPNQPRKQFDESILKELANSIKQHGIIQPLVATPHKDGYRIVAGERRYRASQIAGLKKLPVIIRDHEELEELEISLVENVQRVDLSPLEQAVSIVRLRDQFSLSLKEIAKKLGKAETTVSNIIRLLHLPKEAVVAMQKNLITEGHARAILALRTDEKAQIELLNTIITQKLSVRQAEAIVKLAKGKVNNAKSALSADTKRALKNLNEGYRKRLSVKENSTGGGRVVISFADISELDDIIKSLK